jgi:hypothetical protein
MIQQIGIIGAGIACLNIIKLFKDSNEFKVVIICDVNKNAPAIKYAEKNSITITDNIKNVFNYNIDYLIELTGKNEGVLKAINAYKNDKISVIDSDGAKLFFSLFTYMWEERSEELSELLNSNLQGIESSFEQYYTINSTINLLSINASIEAYSAGEAGKSFAVVAREIKELAKKSSNVTDNIKDELIKIRGLKEEMKKTKDLLK